MKTTPAAPLSRPLAVSTLTENEPQAFAIEAAAGEREALARSLGAPAVHAFAAQGAALAESGGRVRIEGTVLATLTRICVVTLEPFEVEVEEPFAVEFAPEAEAAAAASRAAHEPAPGETLADLPDPPDPIREGRIDLGAIALEFLTLALDPYPRKPGARFDRGSEPDEPSASPFAALAKLKPSERKS